MTSDAKELPTVAGNGLLDRRLFMRTLALGAASTASVGVSLADSVSEGQPEWMLAPGATTQDYGMPSRFELERIEFHRAVRKSYLSISETEPDRFRILDASREINEIHAELVALVEAAL